MKRLFLIWSFSLAEARSIAEIFFYFFATLRLCERFFANFQFLYTALTP